MKKLLAVTLLSVFAFSAFAVEPAVSKNKRVGADCGSREPCDPGYRHSHKPKDHCKCIKIKLPTKN